MPRHPDPARAPAGRLVALLAAVVLVLAACAPGTGSATPAPAEPTGQGPSVLPYIISSEITVGTNRFMFSFLDASGNRPVAAPDRPASVAFVAPGATEPGPDVPGEFIWAIEGERGIYVATAEFPEAGSWTARFTTEGADGGPETIVFGFDVREDAAAVAVGDRAPASDTATAADVDGDLARLSTDTDPDPRFYETSVADALAASTPFVLVFATPAFCQSEQCGPTLDRVKAVAEDHPDLTFINVEPFKLVFTEGRLQPDLDANNRLQPVDTVLEWGILTEPWIYVVDGDGVVRGSFEGVISERELEAAIATATGG
jgi:hypothetical protein